MTKRPNVMTLDDFKAEVAPEPPIVDPVPVVEPEAAIPDEHEAEPEDKPLEPTRKATPGTFRTSLYFHRNVHDVLREIAFRERSTVSDLINEGLESVLKARGYPTAAEIKVKVAPKRKRAMTR